MSLSGLDRGRSLLPTGWLTELGSGDVSRGETCSWTGGLRSPCGAELSPSRAGGLRSPCGAELEGGEISGGDDGSRAGDLRSLGGNGGFSIEAGSGDSIAAGDGGFTTVAGSGDSIAAGDGGIFLTGDDEGS